MASLTKSAKPTDRIASVPKLPKGAKKAGYPGFVEPMLATLRSNPPVGTNWLHEIKFDGYRLQAHLRSGRVKLLTRSGLDWTARFGKALVAALADLKLNEAIIDGEVVVEGAGSVADFSALQDALSIGILIGWPFMRSISSIWMAMICNRRR